MRADTRLLCTTSAAIPRESFWFRFDLSLTRQYPLNGLAEFVRDTEKYLGTNITFPAFRHREIPLTHPDPLGDFRLRQVEPA